MMICPQQEHADWSGVADDVAADWCSFDRRVVVPRDGDPNRKPGCDEGSGQRDRGANDPEADPNQDDTENKTHQHLFDEGARKRSELEPTLQDASAYGLHQIRRHADSQNDERPSRRGIEEVRPHRCADGENECEDDTGARGPSFERVCERACLGSAARHRMDTGETSGDELQAHGDRRDKQHQGDHQVRIGELRRVKPSSEHDIQ